MLHAVRFSVQPGLVRAFLHIPPSLACISRRQKKVLGKERSERAIRPRPSRVMHPIVYGDFRHVNELVELCSQKLARNVVAHVLHRHTFWLSTT